MFKNKLAVTVMLPLFAVAVLSGCGGDDDQDSPNPPVASEVATGPTDSAVATGSTGSTGNDGSSKPTETDTGKPQVDSNKVAVRLGTISDPDNPAAVEKAAKRISRGSADIFTQRDSETFCAIVDPEYIKQQFAGGIEECQERMGKVFAPESQTLDLKAGTVKVKGDTASVTMKTAKGKDAGTAWYIRRGDRWYLDLSAPSAVEAPGSN